MGFWDRTTALHVLLSPLAGLYAVGWWAYEGLYRTGIKRASSPHQPILCVGNLQVGGMGKTPLTIAIAGWLAERNLEVVIGASGYGSRHAADATIAPDGRLRADVWGDEPALIRDALPDVPLVVGRNRVLAAQLVHEQFPGSVLVMDDGFQHLPLTKQVSIVIEPRRRRNPFCFPIGPYREPRTGLSRADYRVEDVKDVLTLHTTLDPSIESVGSQVQVLTSIANPERFIQTVEEVIRPGSIVRRLALRDHDPLRVGNLFDGFDPSLPILVTAKDWVKLRERDDLDPWQIVVVRQQATLSDPSLEQFLLSKIDEIAAQAT